MIRMQMAQNNPYLEELQYILKTAADGVLPKTAAAMEEGAELIQSRWVDFAKGGPLTGITEPLKRPNAGYARSIKTRKIRAYEHEIYSEAKIADQIENGTERVDMKETHTKGPRSRVSEKGVPYLIVPFQWGTKEGTARVGPKNIVPKNLLSLMRSKRFKQSSVKNETYQSPNARGEMVDRMTYSWGSRARGSDFAGTVEQKIFADGMVRFEQEGEKGRKRYGGYFTFRIISANSPANSWIKPATPARHVTRALVDETKDTINAMVDSAILGDIGK